jgi:hypothetical protein
MVNNVISFHFQSVAERIMAVTTEFFITWKGHYTTCIVSWATRNNQAEVFVNICLRRCVSWATRNNQAEVFVNICLRRCVSWATRNNQSEIFVNICLRRCVSWATRNNQSEVFVNIGLRCWLLMVQRCWAFTFLFNYKWL